MADHKNYLNKQWQANLNYLLGSLSEKVRDIHCLSMPAILSIDPSSACQLSCPFCARGSNTTERLPVLLDMVVYNSIMSKFGKYCMEGLLQNIGEPLLNTHIHDIISKLTSMGSLSSLSSNLNVNMNVDYVDKLLLSGLNVLTASIDGNSQETYEKYRVGGSYQLAIDNISILAERNRILNTGCVIYWNFLVFKHNQHEIDDAISRAASIGIPISFKSPSIPNDKLDEWESTVGYGRVNDEVQAKDQSVVDDGTSGYVGEKATCPWPWRGLAIQSTGDVSLCALQFGHHYDIGAYDMSVADLWNGKRNIEARSFNNGYRILDIYIPCMGCAARGMISCHPSRNIPEQDIIDSGIIPDRVLRMYRELSEIIDNGGNYIKLFEELYMHVISI